MRGDAAGAAAAGGDTLLLAYGAFGGMLGTIGSTVWYEWDGEVAIASICAAMNVGVSCIVCLLWIAHKQHPYLRTDAGMRMQIQMSVVSSDASSKSNSAEAEVEICYQVCHAVGWTVAK